MKNSLPKKGVKMYAILGLLGFFGVVLGIIFMIIKAMQNNKKELKIWVYVFVISFIALSLALWLNSKNQSKPTNNASKPTAETTKTADSSTVKTEPTKTIEKSLEQKISDKVKEILGEKSSEDKTRIVKIEDFTETTGMVKIYYNADENLTNKLTKEGMWLDDIKLLKEIPKLNSKITYLGLSCYFPMSDKYGKIEDIEVMYVEVSKESWDKINWDNFLFENLKNIADSYYQHPAFN